MKGGIKPDDFPMYRLPGCLVPNTPLAQAILKQAALNGSDGAEYYKLLSESSEAFENNETSNNPMVRAWRSAFAGFSLTGTEAVSVYAAMAEVIRYLNNDPQYELTIVPAYLVSIDTRSRHVISDVSQTGVAIVAPDAGFAMEGIYYSNDVSSQVIGCTRAMVDQFINIANHLNFEEDDE